MNNITGRRLWYLFDSLIFHFVYDMAQITGRQHRYLFQSWRCLVFTKCTHHACGLNESGLGENSLPWSMHRTCVYLEYCAASWKFVHFEHCIMMFLVAFAESGFCERIQRILLKNGPTSWNTMLVCTPSTFPFACPPIVRIPPNVDDLTSRYFFIA